MFFVDHVARGLGRGVDAGFGYSMVYGLGAIVGPLLADRAGFRPALHLAYYLIALAVVALALSTATPTLVTSSGVVGGFTTGIVTFVLGRVHELVPHDAARQRVV